MPASRMRFDAAGRLTDFGMDRDARKVLVDSGKPFQTSGCPGHGKEISALIVSMAGVSAHSRLPSMTATRRWSIGRFRETVAGAKNCLNRLIFMYLVAFPTSNVK